MSATAEAAPATPVSGAPAAEAVEATPAPVEAVVEVAPTPEPAATPEASESQLRAELTPEPELPASADTFDWVNWDGDMTALPEAARPWAEHAMKRAERELEVIRSEAKEAQQLWQELVNEAQDPRVPKLEGELQAKQSELEAFQAQYAESLKNWKDKEEAQRQIDHAARKAQAEKFEAEHPWIFDNGKVEAAAIKALGEGWEAQNLPALLKLPESLLEKAMSKAQEWGGQLSAQARNDIVRLVLAESTEGRTRVAEAVGGATGAPQTAPHVEGEPDVTQLPRREAAVLAAKRAMKRHMART